jgi:hypothetical protein
VLSSSEALALLIHRLEEEGWHIEREGAAATARVDLPISLTPPARER